MYVKWHVILGFIFSVLLFFLFPKIGFIGFLIIWASSVFLDVDHYLAYVYLKKDWSLIRAYKWHMKKNKKSLSFSRKQRNNFYISFSFLHGIEFLLILFFLTIFISKYFLFILIGAAFHLLLDNLYERKYNSRCDKISLIYDFLKFKKLKKI